MTSKHNTTGHPVPDYTSQDWDVFAGYMQDGLDTALTHFYGASDPSSGAPTPWGAAELGTVWTQDPGGGSYTTVDWIWAELTAGNYGWRRRRIPKLIWLDTPVEAVAAASATEAAYGDVSLAAALSASVQDSGQSLPLVGLVCLRVVITPTAAVAAGDHCYMKFRKKGTTNEFKCKGIVNGVPSTYQIWVGLDTSEVMQVGYETNAAASGFDFTCHIVGAIELQ